MTIHHDKLAYGRLAKTSEDLTEDKILEMLNNLSQSENNRREDGKMKFRKKRGKKDITATGDFADTETGPATEDFGEVEEGGGEIAESVSIAEDGGSDGGDDGE